MTSRLIKEREKKGGEKKREVSLQITDVSLSQRIRDRESNGGGESVDLHDWFFV